MTFLQLLWKFNGDIFHGLGEKWIWKLLPKILPVDLNINNYTIIFYITYYELGKGCSGFWKSNWGRVVLVLRSIWA